jgi:hypothetical protein
MFCNLHIKKEQNNKLFVIWVKVSQARQLGVVKRFM